MGFVYRYARASTRRFTGCNRVGCPVADRLCQLKKFLNFIKSH